MLSYVARYFCITRPTTNTQPCPMATKAHSNEQRKRERNCRYVSRVAILLSLSPLTYLAGCGNRKTAINSWWSRPIDNPSWHKQYRSSEPKVTCTTSISYNHWSVPHGIPTYMLTDNSTHLRVSSLAHMPFSWVEATHSYRITPPDEWSDRTL